MAEGLLKKYLRELGKGDIEVISAGTYAIDGMSPTEETIDVMKKEGIGVSGFKAKSVTKELIKKSDLILVMTSRHMDDIIAMAPQAASKIHMFKQFGIKCETQPCEDLDIADPIGRDKDCYEKVFSEIKEEVKRITRLV